MQWDIEVQQKSLWIGVVAYEEYVLILSYLHLYCLSLWAMWIIIVVMICYILKAIVYIILQYFIVYCGFMCFFLVTDMAACKLLSFLLHHIYICLYFHWDYEIKPLSSYLTIIFVLMKNLQADSKSLIKRCPRKLDESTARLQLKSPQSLSGRSIPLVTFEAWSSIDMFAFRFVAIGPLLAEI